MSIVLRIVLPDGARVAAEIAGAAEDEAMAHHQNPKSGGQMVRLRAAAR